MNKWLKHLQSVGRQTAQTLTGCGVVLSLAAALVAPSELSAAPFTFGFDSNSGPAAFGQVRDDLLLVHCCHSHPYAPYDRYCCHGTGATVARTAAGAAVAYGAYRGVRSATKSAYKSGYSKAKKHYKRRR